MAESAADQPHKVVALDAAVVDSSAVMSIFEQRAAAAAFRQAEFFGPCRCNPIRLSCLLLA